MIEYKYNIDVTPGRPPLEIQMKQYDSDFQIVFALISRKGELELESGTTAKIRGTKADGYGYSVNATVDIAKKTVTVQGDEQMTVVPGRMPFELSIYKGTKLLNTATFYLKVMPDALDDGAIMSESDLSDFRQAIEAAVSAAASATDAADSAAEAAAELSGVEEDIEDLQTDVNAIKASYGTPLVAATASAMTDHTKIYVYTGSETGYTSGNWYYWNGSAWTSGGVYNSTAFVTDTTLALAGRAADAKKVGDEITATKDAINEIDGTLETKANIDGYYDGMTVGQVEQVLSNVKETERSPYIFRASGGSLEIGDREQDTLVGMDLVWNQLVVNGDFASTSGWVEFRGTLSVANNVATLTAKSSGDVASLNISRSITDLKGHKAFISFDVRSDIGGQVGCLLLGSSGTYKSQTISANTWTKFQKVVSVSSTISAIYLYGVATNSSVTDFKNVNVIDLTAMFGSTIADYIYSLEQGTAGAGVAWVKRYLTKGYYPYSAPTMSNGVASSHDMVGFNQWDEEWEVGTYGNSGGKLVKSTVANVIRCKNPIRVLPNTTYRFDCINPNYNSGLYIWEAESINSQITKSDSVQSGRTMSFTTTANAKSVFVAARPGYGETYKNDLCFHLEYDGERDGEYEPYVKHSYTLDDTVDLHGIPKIDASGNLYADGDIYEADGTVRRNYTLSIADNSVTGNWDTNVFTIGYMNTYGGDDSNAIPDIRIEGYETVSYGSYSSKDKCVTVNPKSASQYPNIVIIKDTSCSTISDMNTALNGKKILRKNKVSTTESAEPFQTPQIVDNWGTEEYVTEGDIPIGHTTDYPINIRAKVEVAPDAPETDGTYLMQRLNGVNSYIPFVKELPTFPSEDGNYLLGLAVSGSGTTKTLSWEVQS